MKSRDGFTSVALLLSLQMFALMVTALVTWFYLSVHFTNPSEHVQSLIETCSYTWKVGFCTLTGAFVSWARTHLAGPY